MDRQGGGVALGNVGVELLPSLLPRPGGRRGDQGFRAAPAPLLRGRFQGLQQQTIPVGRQAESGGVGPRLLPEGIDGVGAAEKVPAQEVVKIRP